MKKIRLTAVLYAIAAAITLYFFVTDDPRLLTSLILMMYLDFKDDLAIIIMNKLGETDD